MSRDRIVSWAILIIVPVVIGLAFCASRPAPAAVPNLAIEDERPAKPPAVAEHRCVPLFDLVMASRLLGSVAIIRGDVATVLVGRVWQASGFGEAPPFELAVIVFFGLSHVGVAPIHAGVACVNIVVPKGDWDAAVGSLPKVAPSN